MRRPRFRRRARAGLYAHAKYQAGLRAYRRRMRAPLLIVVVPMALFFFFVMSSRELDAWSLAAGAVGASAVALFMFVRDDPPPHVVNWGRGAEGERKTESARLKKRYAVSSGQAGRWNTTFSATGARTSTTS